MRKLFTKIITIVTLLPLIPSLEVLAFSDLGSSHENFEAIEYLEEAGILEGYGDGTFRPDLEVNRVEFLKIVIEGSNIPTDIEDETPFNDVNYQEWYGGYLKKAYKEGWIEGYDDGSFRPTNTINKVEALKILALAQNWSLPTVIDEKPFNDVFTYDWFAPYVFYAKEHNYLDTSSSNLNPGDLMSRGGISQIIYQSYVDLENEIELIVEVEEEQEEDPEEEVETVEEEIVVDFTPESHQMVSNNFFDKIIMDEDLTNTYYTNEVFYFNGEVTSGSYDKVTAIFDPEDHGEESIYVNATVIDGEFSIPVHFDFSGNFNIGFLPGNGGTSKAFGISVMPLLPESDNSEDEVSPNDFSVEFEDDKTKVTFDSQEDIIKRINFKQGGKSISYLSRQETEEVEIRFQDFENFNEGEVEVFIESAKISDNMPLEITSDFNQGDSQDIDATTHQFSEIDEDLINISPPSTLSTTAPFMIPGSLNDDAAQIAFVIKPDGFVEELDLITSDSISDDNGVNIIDSGGDFNYYYEPESTGTHIIEINNKNGQALINHPIYIGDSIPLLPDYFDLNEREFYSSGALDIDDLRDELLDLINQIRGQHGLTSITTASDLNNLAQLHSEDMADNDFFGHINLEGQSPNDRRLELGIETSVGENIAKDVSIDFAHLGLIRSASHRKNILTPEWTKVGLGIAEEDGYLYVSEEFSTDILSNEDLEEMEVELLDEINQLRDDNQINHFTYKDSLEHVGTYINNAIILDEETLTDQLFSESLAEYSITGSSKAIGRSFNIWNSMLDSLLEEEEFSDANWKSIGIDIEKDSEGILQAVVVLNTQI
jgi:uncharacterized protein YkwD